MKSLLEFIAKSILDHSEDVEVIEETTEDGALRLTLKVNKDDVGKAIGKEGKVANAMRNLLKVIAVKEGKRVYLDIREKEL